MCGSSGTGIGRALKDAGKKLERNLKKVHEPLVDLAGGGLKEIRGVQRDFRAQEQDAKQAERAQVKQRRDMESKRYAQLQGAAMRARRRIGLMQGQGGSRTLLGGGANYTGKRLLGS